MINQFSTTVEGIIIQSGRTSQKLIEFINRNQIKVRKSQRKIKKKVRKDSFSQTLDSEYYY